MIKMVRKEKGQWGITPDRTGLICPRIGTLEGSVEGSYEHGNGCANLIKFGDFLLAPLAV
jgi:hypothetical protein